MEEMRIEFSKSIEILAMFSSWKTLSIPSSNDPLFSCITTLYILILLYFPQSFSLKILLSPVLVLTASLLLSLLRLQTGKRILANEAEKTGFSQKELKWGTSKKHPDLIIQSFEETFVEWDVGAPLEIIYEEYEGEEEVKEPNPSCVIERYPSLSLYYPESDTDSSSSSEADFPANGDWVTSEKMCYRWEEEDREGLIEIALDKRDFEEENLIEIDLFSSVKG